MARATSPTAARLALAACLILSEIETTHGSGRCSYCGADHDGEGPAGPSDDCPVRIGREALAYDCDGEGCTCEGGA